MGLFSDDPDFGNNLMNFGLATMAAAGEPGAQARGTLGVLGQGGVAAQNMANTQAQTQYMKQMIQKSQHDP